MLVEGVLNGSKGPLYYPLDEIARNADGWNAMPLTVGHPTAPDGSHISARDPAVLNKHGIGYVFRTEANGKLTGEGWFDVEATRRVDSRILSALEAGRSLELSTGLFTDNEPAPDGAVFNGTPYTHVARNYRPDHLAILPDEIGACSRAAGCGVLVNSEAKSLMQRLIDLLLKRGPAANSIEGSPMSKLSQEQRNALATAITTNCPAFKDARKTVDAWDDAQLTAVANLAKPKLTATVTVNAEGEEEVATGIDVAALADFLGIDIDPKADPLGYTKALTDAVEGILKQIKGAAPEPEPEVAAAPAATVANRNRKAPIAQPLKGKDLIAALPPEDRQAMDWAKTIVKNQMTAFKERLKAVAANTSNPVEREHINAILAGNPSYETLSATAALVGNVGIGHSDTLPNYAGAAGAPTGNVKDDSDNVLPIQEYDFAAYASPKLRRQA